jgi:hypothetical protein
MRVLQTFRFDKGLLSKFRKLAKERGHTMTWYLEGCMRDVVGEKRREVIPATKLFDLKGKPVKPLGKLTKSKRKRKS